MTLRLLLIRHGRVDFESREFRRTPRGPQWDPPLHGRGREQSERLAARLSSLDRPLALFASPMRRCLQTLEPYQRITGMGFTVEEDLREVFIGDWEGVPFEELIARHQDDIRQRLHDQRPLFGMAPGAETGLELRTRVAAAVERCIHPFVDGGAEGDVVLVVHGGVINAYLGHAMGLADGHDMFFLPENTSLNSVIVEGAERRIHFLSDAAHLELPPAFWTARDGAAGSAQGY